MIAVATSYWLYQHPVNCNLELRQGCITLETAQTSAQRAKGLSGRDSLRNDQGMVFIFERPQKACFWMKDTNFDLDIIWLNDQKQITQIRPQVSPDDYPEIYCAGPNTKYVIELPAGATARNQLVVGQQIDF